MYKRSPQKSPQLMILNLRSHVLTETPSRVGACVKKRLRGFEIA